ncbi:hypothetical protein REPUB_Repub07fG0118100 [Reevesia pubescens]
MRRKKSRAKRRVVRSSEEDVVELEVKDQEPWKDVDDAAKAGNERGKDIDREIDCFKEGFEEVENVETMGEGNVRAQNFNSNIGVSYVDSGDVIENGEEAKANANAEQKSVEGEPSYAIIEVMKLDGHIDDIYSNKEIDDGEEDQENRDDKEQNDEIEVFNPDSLTEQEKEKQLEIHVGGLHKDTVEQELFEIFGKFGEVQSARIVRHPTTNKSKGFAFIQYATVEQAKEVLSDLKDGIEVRGKLVKLSISRDRDILYLGNICKTWTKEDVLGKLKGYRIEGIDEIQVPNDPKNDKKIKGYALLRFNTCSNAKAAFHCLRKPDAVFGYATGAKVAFACTPMHSREKVRLQVKTIYVEGIPKSWDVQKLKEICEQYGETKKVKISRNFGYKGKDFGFISFTTRESAVACVRGIKLQFGGNVKVKAYMARPLVGGRLQKSSCGGLKFNRRHRISGWLKMKGHARSEGARKEIDLKAHTVIYKSKIRGTEEKTTTVAHKNNQDLLNSKPTIEGETKEQKSVAPEVDGAGGELSTKPKKTGHRRKNRKRRRDRIHGKRPSKKPEGSSHSRPSHSSRNSKKRSNLRKGPSSGADCIAYRIPFKQAYMASSSGYPGSAYSAISGSKRLSSTLEVHAGFMQPVKPKDQYHAAYVTPGFQHERQTYAGYLKLDTHYEREPPAKYFKSATGKDALPHAGLLEPAFRKQSFDVDDYLERRTAEYNGPGNQGPVQGAASVLPSGIVPRYTSYARYEVRGSVSGYHRVSGMYPPTQFHY